MPLYDYRCENCSHEFEALQRVNQDALTECPICSEHALKKQASAPAFTFKGGGWYKDGYGSSGGDKPDKPNSDAKDKKSETSDSKPAKKDSAKTDSAKSSTSTTKPDAGKKPSK